jgi:hypothetical protein
VTKALRLVSCLFAGTAYLALVSAQYIAFRYSQKDNIGDLQKATWLQPGNAEYQHRLGQLLMQAQRLSGAADAYSKAVRLNRRRPGYWISLATAEGVLGRLRDERHALEQAIAADPKDGDAAWAAGNTYLAEGDIDSALREFRVVLESSPSVSGQALQLCWEARPDVDLLLRDTIPANPDIYSSFLEFLMSRGESASAARVWARTVELRQPVQVGTVFDYIPYLVRRNQSPQARLVWQQAADLCDLRNYQPSTDNLIVNGDFRLDILNGGFDWRYEKRSDVTLALDPTEPHLGSRSLLISYDSRGLEDSGIRQLIPVEPDTSYQVSAYFKTRNMEGAGGPHFVLQDYYTEKPTFESVELKDAQEWQQVSGEFKTTPETSLLIVRMKRVPAGSPIRGKLWIDNVRLKPGHKENVP